MPLRMQLRRIVIMMIIEYAMPSLALYYPCKEYQIIYESVHIYLCTCMRNKYPCKSEFVWIKCPHTSYVEGNQFLNSQHAWACWNMVAGGIVFEIPRLTDWQSNVHFLSSNEWTICPDINGFQIPLKTLCTQDTDDAKQKTSLFSVQGKSAWYCFKAVVILFYVIFVRHTK